MRHNHYRQATIRRWLADAIDPRLLWLSWLVFVPLVVLRVVTGQEHWLFAGIFAADLLLGRESSGLALSGVLLHAAVIIVGYCLLMIAGQSGIGFILACTLWAGLATALPSLGKNLRAAGLYAFIVPLYLACLMQGQCHPAGMAEQAMACGSGLLPYLLGVALLVALASELEYWYRQQRLPGWRRLLRLTHNDGFGEGMATRWAAITMCSAVAVMAVLVWWLHLPSGQWAIWSAGSIVNAGIAGAPRKLAHRLFAAFVGVPTGAVIGLLLPHSTLVSALALLLVLSALTALKSYPKSVILRYGLDGFILASAGVSLLTVAVRPLDVFLGGIVGLFSVVLFAGIRSRVSRLAI